MKKVGLDPGVHGCNPPFCSQSRPVAEMVHCNAPEILTMDAYHF